MNLTGSLIAVVGIALAFAGAMAEPAYLELEAKIPLGGVSGRIDHLAIDLDRQRLFVAELGNDSVGVVDLKARQLLRTITGLKEPQGVGYVPSTDTLYVANAGDGSVRLFQGPELSPGPHIELGDDADNIRVDAQSNRVFVGYGKGLAVIDPATRAKVADVALKEHPEGFQLDRSTGRLFVNLPDANQIAVVDTVAAKLAGAWPMREARSNFPMALDDDSRKVIAVFRRPARLIVFDAQNGAVAANIAVCSDADDMFVDARRHRLYVSCGGGFVDVIQQSGANYARVRRVPTASGARTSFLSPEMDRLFVAVRATGGEPAAIWVYRPTP